MRHYRYIGQEVVQWQPGFQSDRMWQFLAFSVFKRLLGCLKWRSHPQHQHNTALSLFFSFSFWGPPRSQNMSFWSNPDSQFLSTQHMLQIMPFLHFRSKEPKHFCSCFFALLLKTSSLLQLYSSLNLEEEKWMLHQYFIHYIISWLGNPASFWCFLRFSFFLLDGCWKFVSL